MGKFLDMEFFCCFLLLSSSARAMFLSFLPFCVGFVVFFRVVVEEKRFVLFPFLLLHKVIFSIDERFVIGFRGKVCYCK